MPIVGLASLAVGCTNLPVRSSSASRSSDGGGFFGWHFQAPFDTDEIKTVYIFIKSQTFRRDLQLQLTEALAKEIDMRTPYKVVGNPNQANSILSGTITFDNKGLQVEAPTNLPRELTATVSIWVKWTHNPPTEDEEKRQATLVSETTNFVPEVGETSLTAFDNEVIGSIAKQIVDMMEKPWFNERDLE